MKIRTHDDIIIKTTVQPLAIHSCKFQRHLDGAPVRCRVGSTVGYFYSRRVNAPKPFYPLGQPTTIYTELWSMNLNR
jgi:hypothetical protein